MEASLLRKMGPGSRPQREPREAQAQQGAASRRGL